MSAQKTTDNTLVIETHEFDVQAGARLRELRLEKGLTQEKLGTLLGLTFQQIQKYERGANRMSGGRIAEIAKLLGVPVTSFYPDDAVFSGLAEDGQEALEGTTPKKNTDAKETEELLKAYYNIKDKEKRLRVLDLIRAMADK